MSSLVASLFPNMYDKNCFSYGEKHRDVGYQDAHSYSIIPKEVRSQIEKREKEEAKEAKDV